MYDYAMSAVYVGNKYFLLFTVYCYPFSVKTPVSGRFPCFLSPSWFLIVTGFDESVTLDYKKRIGGRTAEKIGKNIFKIKFFKII